MLGRRLSLKLYPVEIRDGVPVVPDGATQTVYECYPLNLKQLDLLSCWCRQTLVDRFAAAIANQPIEVRTALIDSEVKRLIRLEWHDAECCKLLATARGMAELISLSMRGALTVDELTNTLSVTANWAEAVDTVNGLNQLETMGIVNPSPPRKGRTKKARTTDHRTGTRGRKQRQT